jgi:F-box associated protein
MPLSGLPREVLLTITDHLDDADLNALSRTNSQIYNLLNQHLYRRDMARSQMCWDMLLDMAKSKRPSSLEIEAMYHCIGV